MYRWRVISRSLSSQVGARIESRRGVSIPTRRVSAHPLPVRYKHTMASADELVTRLTALSLGPKLVEHPATNSPAAWKEALAGASGVPAQYELVKTLVYKPKTAKSATPVPVIAIVREETETSSGALGKKLNLKELRLANEELMKEFFNADKDSSKSHL